MQKSFSTPQTVWDLPPLILHPFNERVSASTLLENSKAALMLAGLIPGDGSDEDSLRMRLLAGRLSEVRMLFFVGKDVARWLEQCCDCAGRIGDPDLAEVHPQSFAGLLTSNPPPNVREKLVQWGVADHSSIFSRAIGIHSLFAEPPSLTAVKPDFLRNYHRFADALYRCYMESEQYRSLSAESFRFDLYASGEYSRLLESEWGERSN